MAAEDYNVADRAPEGGFPVTAADKVAETVQETPDAATEAWRAANGADRRTAAFVGYAAALDAHGNRADIEHMESRVRRDTGVAGAAFANQDHMRAVPGVPGPGSVEGEAPASAAGQAARTAGDDEEATTSTQSEPTNEPTLAARTASGDSDGDGKDDNNDATKA